ncbi:MAG: ABC transporter permease [Methanocalculus sp. MSAO_Arc1]|uniref:ABC transporter permease n=1 Tax=Methanocalculus TaxID=71151 RepID=UPI000FF4FF04|nr:MULTISPECIES: ABC transporter permease [unclassified Methanocalculus]MCP1661706.1 osmoprotectant transport system permease protein [Methanocalculus sp. AMF5]RQD80499.1 MAG: ABC transporter permease [Methanocalculus sp. MSAO_Arc1]
MPDELQMVWVRYNLTERTIEHLQIFSIALLIGILIGVATGLFLYRRRKFSPPVFSGLNAVQTFPDIALLILLIPLAGIGTVPTIIACVIYSILPIARNTYTGLISVSPELLEVGRAMGLVERDILLKIRLPFAFPMIAGGIRIAIVFTMGIVTLGGIFGAGGLGAPLQTGINLIRPDIILVAGIWVGVLAVFLDGIAGGIEAALKRRTGSW